MEDHIYKQLKAYGYSDDEIKEFKERQKKTDVFMEKYNKNRECCPKCGSNSFTTTLVGYIFDLNKVEEYKDKNNCTCSNCGDEHIYHDRVPVKQEENEK